MIQVAAERGAVEHVLSDAEEQRLFKALQKADRRHTIPVFIAALETGARWSSLVEFLKWKHVNFKAEEVMLHKQTYELSPFFGSPSSTSGNAFDDQPTLLTHPQSSS